MFAANNGDYSKCLVLLKNGSVVDIPHVCWFKCSPL